MNHPALSRLSSQSIRTASFETSYIEAGSGPPLLLLHDGGPGADSVSGWNGAIEEFAGDRQVLALDTLGFGNSMCPDGCEHSQTERTRHAIEFIEHTGLAPLDVIGNSMGGITALDVAASRPELVKRMLLVAPAGIKAAIPEAAMPLLTYRGSRENMQAVFAALAAPGFEADTGLVDHRTASYRDPRREAAWQAAMEWIGRQEGLYLSDAHIASIQADVLVMAGKCDPLIPPTVALRLTDLIGRCSCFVTASCGHWIVLEQPRSFTQLSTAFLDGRLT